MGFHVRAEYLSELLRAVPSADPKVLLGPDIAVDDLADGERLVDGALFFDALVRAAQLSGDPSFGWSFGQRLGTSKHGFMGYLARSCATLREVFVYDTHFLTTRVTVLSASLHDLGASTRLTIHTAVPLGPAWPLVIDLILGCLARLGEEILPDGVFVAASPGFVVDAQELGVSITMPSELLEVRLRHADERLKELAAQQCARALAEHPAHLTTARQVAVVLAESLDAATTLDSVAKRLAMSPRTLRRKLEADGTSFQKLLDEAREARARHYLRATTMTVDEIAAELAFSSASSFSQAFKRWTGVSPGQFRSTGEITAKA